MHRLCPRVERKVSTAHRSACDGVAVHGPCPRAGVKWHAVTDGVMEGGGRVPVGGRGTAECGDGRGAERGASCAVRPGQTRRAVVPAGPECTRPHLLGSRGLALPGSHRDGSTVWEHGAEALWDGGPGPRAWGAPWGMRGRGSQGSEALRGEQGGQPWAQEEPAFQALVHSGQGPERQGVTLACSPCGARCEEGLHGCGAVSSGRRHRSLLQQHFVASP